MNLTARIPVLAALPLLLLGCEEETTSSDTGAVGDAGDAGGGDTTQENDATQENDTTPAVDTSVDTDVVEDTDPGAAFSIPSTAPDLSTIDCDTASGVDAFFCEASAYCEWGSTCDPDTFARSYASIEECESTYADYFVDYFAGTGVPEVCLGAITAYNACAFVDCGVSVGTCDTEYSAMMSTCDMVMTEESDQKSAIHRLRRVFRRRG